MKKKLRIITIGIAGVIAYFIGKDLVTPEILRAESEDNGWKVAYTMPILFQRTGKLELSWDKREGEIVGVALQINSGLAVTNIEVQIPTGIDLFDSGSYEFTGFRSERFKKENSYSILIRWEEDGVAYSENIIFDGIHLINSKPQELRFLRFLYGN